MKNILQVLLITLVFYSVPFAQNTEAPTGEGGLDRAMALYDQKDYAAASVILLELCESGIDDGLASQLMGKAYYQLGEFEKADEWFETSLKINDKDPETHVWLSWVYGEYLNDAGMFRAIKYSKKFRRSLNTALALDPDNYWAHIGLMHFYEEAPRIAGGSFAKAEASAEEASRIDPVKGTYELVELFTRNKQFEKAQVLMERFAEANPEDPEPRVSVLAIKIQAKDFADWLSAYERFEKAFGDYLAAQYQFGKFSAITGKEVDRGEKYLNYYLSQKEENNRPSHAGAWWRLGMILEHKHLPEDAYQAYNQAHLLEPESEAITKSWETMGITLGVVEK